MTKGTPPEQEVISRPSKLAGVSRMSPAFSGSLRSWLKLAAFLLAAGLPSVLLLIEGVHIMLAARLGDSPGITDVRRAVSLDPANPELHFHLGVAETYSLEPSNSAEGIQQLQLATKLSPRETRYWEALASACQFVGDKNCATHAIALTLAMSPMAPRVHWEAANYYLWANREDLALSQFRRLLEIDPSYAEATFRASLGAQGGPETVDREVLTSAASPGLRLAYVDFLATSGDDDSAFHIWKEVAASKSAFRFSLANPYLEHLIRTHQYQDALNIWHDLGSRGLLRQGGDDDQGNGVFNGGFEQIPLNAGFDWRYQRGPYVAVDFEDHHAYQGERCLRLDFSDVANHQDEPVYQLVPVRPDQTYMLTARIRSNNITSASDPYLRVIDAACPQSQCLSASSDAVAGTTPWHQVSLKFRTGPHTRVVRLSVWRARSLGYPTEILGTLWLDAVSLRTTEPANAVTIGQAN